MSTILALWQVTLLPRLRGSTTGLGCRFQPFRVNDLEMVDLRFGSWNHLPQLVAPNRNAKVTLQRRHFTALAASRTSSCVNTANTNGCDSRKCARSRNVR
jgi:hypothetical protein